MFPFTSFENICFFVCLFVCLFACLFWLFLPFILSSLCFFWHKLIFMHSWDALGVSMQILTQETPWQANPSQHSARILLPEPMRGPWEVLVFQQNPSYDAKSMQNEAMRLSVHWEAQGTASVACRWPVMHPGHFSIYRSSLGWLLLVLQNTLHPVLCQCPLRSLQVTILDQTFTNCKICIFLLQLSFTSDIQSFYKFR